MKRILLIALLLAWPAACRTEPARPAWLPEGVAEIAFASAPLEIRTGDGRVLPFTVELALSRAQQARGLMYRTHLAPDAGMLFPMNPPRPANFWMKNTRVSLDMVFVAPGGTIESILPDVPPLTLDPRQSRGPVAAVLELPAGTTARLGIHPGDQVSYGPGP